MSRLTILDQIQIASPCDANWAEMAGDDRTRFCSDCSKHVYNIAALTAEDAKALIVATEGRVCLRIYKRNDGTVLTADCPVGLGRVSAGRRIRRALAMGLVLPALVVAGVAAKGLNDRKIAPFPNGPGSTWDDQVEWALITLGLKTPTPPPTMGKIMMGSPRMTLPPLNSVPWDCTEDQPTTEPGTSP